jgi:anti-sigma factor ChrR (cupin superfamily)
MDTAITGRPGLAEPIPAPHHQQPTSQEVNPANMVNRANRATTATPRPLLDNTEVVHHNTRAMVKVKVKASTEAINNSSNTQAATDHKLALADTADNRATAEAARLVATASKLGTVDPRKVTTADPAITTTTSTTR